jgi:excisionase family DNA binding protein
MAHTMTAEDLYQDLKKMPTTERQKFFAILSTNAFRSDDMSHEQLFGHLASDNFTAQEAAEYLEVSMSTFRRFVASNKLKASLTVGRNKMFAVADLKVFKKALKIANG